MASLAHTRGGSQQLHSSGFHRYPLFWYAFVNDPVAFYHARPQQHLHDQDTGLPRPRTQLLDGRVSVWNWADVRRSKPQRTIPQEGRKLRVSKQQDRWGKRDRRPCNSSMPWIGVSLKQVYFMFVI